MKRIVILGAPFEYYQGGAEYQYRMLERELNTHHEVFYLFRHPGKCMNGSYISYDYRIRKNYHEYVFTDAWCIYNLLYSLSPDVVYKRGINYITAIGVLFAKRNQCKSILHIASERDVTQRSFKNKKNLVYSYMDKVIARYCIHNVDSIICQAEYQNSLLEKNFQRAGDLIIPNFHPIPKDTPTKEGRKKILWIGNLKQTKQPELFVRLAWNFRHERDVEFIMIGRSGGSAWDKRVVDGAGTVPNLRYLGELSLCETNEWLAKSHVLVNTSIYEGFPNTFIQAWMRGVPVISLNVDPDNIIANKKLGFRSKSFLKMIEHVRFLIRNELARNMTGINCRDYARGKFSMSNAKLLVRVIERKDSKSNESQ